ncbi:MAG: hypothetical protein KY475_12980 [Planctomycetes bacterium]|nr:hypothetical protein [Planctomycetota bacterium]
MRRTGFGACCERQYSPLDGLWANYCQERPRRHPASIFFGALHIDRRRWSCCPGPCGECDGHAASMGPVPTHALPESHLPMAPSSETDAHPADAPPQEAGPVEELPSEDPPIEVTPPEVPEEAPGAWLPIPRSNRRPR